MQPISQEQIDVAMREYQALGERFSQNPSEETRAAFIVAHEKVIALGATVLAERVDAAVIADLKANSERAKNG